MYPSIDEWINKIWYIPTMEYYSGIKRICSTTRMSLENIKLNEKSQIPKSHIIGFHLYEISRTGKCWRQKVDYQLSGAEGVGNGE